mgnify:CR=1 FL=1
MRIFKHWDGPDPGGTPGRVFTASIGQEKLTRAGAYLDHLRIGLKGDIATAAVAIEAFADVLSEYDVWVGSDLRIKADGNDLCALMALYFKQLPVLGENSHNTGTDVIGGLKVPLQVDVPENLEITHAATRTAVTNVSVETISVSGYWLDANPGRKPIHCVVVTWTSNGSTGDEIKDFRLPPIGRLVGMILAMPAASDFTDANFDISAQRVKLLKDSTAVAELNTLGDAEGLEEVNFVSLSIYGDLLARYKRFDFRPEGFDLKSGTFNLKIDNQDASDALRLLPIIEIE